MKKPKQLRSNSVGNVLFQIIETDENGNVLSVSYEVRCPSGMVLDTFSSLSEAEAYLESLEDADDDDDDDINRMSMNM
ncbi:hypothetical protein JG636_18055 [Vibrio cholerae]|uniref:hypothetical protein n=1 Tax=Vibrio cholerae TaxID=666 RepID=UPI0018F0AEDA|nr:hypothetical protein [Vibrio cholerae]EJL6763157.1 hypothetical protein [Vibrio cholerae]EKF9982523.1 hypothetical protein [Vibrio cholerae]MBJ6915332.1 hypothetical protein [Vibrio cholerae]MBJ6919040.1 hypothetical protein [Vibrio cholerae]MBJ6930460.1 hypothetical protein [Vibrio cholerae]